MNKDIALSEQLHEILNLLPKQDAEQFASIIQQTVVVKSTQIENALNDALLLVPLPLRSTTKKLFWPKK